MGPPSARVVIGPHAASAPTGVGYSWNGSYPVVTWAAPADLGVPALTGYIVEVTYFSAGAWTTASFNTTSTSFSVSPQYLFNSGCDSVGCSVRVFATTGTVMGPPSARVVIGTGPIASVAGAPTNLVATRAANDKVDLSWSLPTTGSAVLGMEVTSGDGQHWVFGPLTTVAGFPCFSANTCSFTIAALNAAGTGTSSAPASVGPAALSNAPTNLVATRAANDKVDLSWSLPTTGSAVLGMEVTSGDGQHWVFGPLTTVAGFPCFSANTCSFTIAALNAAGTGTSSAPATVSLTPPGSPTSLSVSLPNGYPSLSWAAPTVSAAASYTIGSDSGRYWLASTTNAYVSCPLAGACSFTVQSASRNGDSGSVRVSLLNSAPTAPAVTDIKLLSTGATRVSWSPPASLGNGSLLGYDLYWSYQGLDGVAFPFVYAGRSGATATSATVVCPFSVVLSGSTCSYAVAAVNQFGSSDAKALPFSYAPPRPVVSLFGHGAKDAQAGDPVSMATGNLTGAWTDLSSPLGAWSMDWSRSYNSRDTKVGVLGVGWSTILDVSMTLNGDGSYTYRDVNGRELQLALNQAGGWQRPEDLNAEFSTNATGPALTWFSGEVWQFNTSGQLLSQQGWEGQTVTFTRTAGVVTSAVSSSGYGLTFGYTLGRLSSVSSSLGRSAAYVYNASGFVTSVSVDGRLLQSITPDASGRLQQLADPTGVVQMANTFDTSGRVTLQSSSAGSPVSFVYSSTADRDITVMTDTVTLAVSRFEFDKGGRLLTSVDPNGFGTSASYDVAGNRTATDSRSGVSTSSAFDTSGRPTQVVTDDAGSTGVVYDTAGRVASMTDTFGRQTVYTYDGAERLPSSTTASDGTVTTANIVNGLVMSTTDADGVTLTYGYDTQRRVTSTTDAYGHKTSLTYTAKGQLETVTDPAGAVTLNTYDPYGGLSSIKDALLKSTSYTYDNADRLLTVTDPTGAVTTNTYDTAGRLKTVSDPVGQITTYGYDTAGRVKTVTAPGAAVTTYGYDALNRVASVTDPLGRVTKFGYDPDGHRNRVTDPSGAVTTTVFDGAGRPSSVADPLGRVTRNVYDSFGRLAQVVDPAGQATTIGYDNRDRVNLTTDPRGAQTSTTSTPAGRVKTQTAPTGVVATSTYDLAGRRSKVTGPTGDFLYGFDPVSRVNSVTTPGLQVSTTTFDPVGRVLTAKDPAGVVTTNTWTDRGELKTTGATGAGTTLFEYNPDRTLKQVTDANSKVTKYSYDGRKNRTTITNANTPTAGVDTTVFDLADQPTSVKDPLQRETLYTYDPVGRVASMTDPSARQLTYSYDPAGQMTGKAVTGGNTYQYSYDNLGRRTSVAAGGQAWTTAWDPGNLLTARTDPNGRTTRWTYDTAGRMTGLIYPDGSNLNYSYDTASRLSKLQPGEIVADNFTGVTGAVLNAGKWTQTLTAGGTASIQANTAKLTTTNTGTSAVLETSKAATTAEVDVRFTYTAADITAANNTSLTIAGRKTTANEYRLTLPSIDGTAVVAKKVGTVITQLASFTIPGTGARTVRFQLQGTHMRTKIWAAGTVEPAAWTTDTVDTAITAVGSTAIGFTRVAGLNSVTIDDFSQTNPTTPPAATATYTYNNDSQYTGETLNGGSRTWAYTTGRLTNYSQTLGTTTTSTAIGYDSSGRLKTETTGTLTKTYGYDSASQLLSVTPSTGSATTYTYDNLGRRATVKVGTAAATAYTYDAASQLSKAGTTTYTYDGAGRRTAETAGTTVTGYTYDAQGRLVSNTRGTTTVTRGYDPDDNLTTVTNGASVTGIDWDPTSGLPQPTILGGQRYVRGPDGVVASRTGVVDTNLGRDVYGSLISPTASARATSYDAFGKPVGGTASWTPTLGYRGEIIIDSLTYLRARNYDMNTGTFTSRDPLGGTPGSPVGSNPYHYGSNNPLMNIDPTGMSNIGDGLFTSYVDGKSYEYSGDQVKVGGQWINQYLFLDMMNAQLHAEAESANLHANDSWAMQVSYIALGEVHALGRMAKGMATMAAHGTLPGAFLPQDAGNFSVRGTIDGIVKPITDCGNAIMHGSADPVAVGDSCFQADVTLVTAADGGFQLGKLGVSSARAGVTESSLAAAEAATEAASSANSGTNLGRQLASEQQMGELGIPQSGANSQPFKPLRAADGLAENYGGNAADWSKMSSSSYTGPDGRMFETHWYENTVEGIKTEFKTKFQDSSWLGFK